jgi:hypothetical protein
LRCLTIVLIISLPRYVKLVCSIVARSRWRSIRNRALCSFDWVRLCIRGSNHCLKIASKNGKPGSTMQKMQNRSLVVILW